MNNRWLIGLLLCCTMPLRAWEWWPLPMAAPHNDRDTLYYVLSASALASSGEYAPFWLQANRDGDIAAAPFSGNLQAGIIKPESCKHRWWDYDFAFTLTGRLQSRTQALHPAANYLGTGYTNLAYAHVRLYIIDVSAGIRPQQYGIPDAELTTGGLLWSRNAHPIPGVHIGIDRWTAVPGLFGYVEVLGGWDHLWQMDNVYIQHGKIHHKWAGIQLGGRWPVNISYQFHHVAQWGGTSPVYGDLGNDWQAYKAAVLVRSGGTMANDQHNAQGNHIGSQILTLTAKGAHWRVEGYWHNLFEDGPIRFIGCGQNRADGLWGIHAEQYLWPFISGVTYEYLATTCQSGPFHDRDGYVFGGADSYFRNSVYCNGWNFAYRTIGTPFITSPIYNSDGSLMTLNSRVRTHFVGLRGDIFGYRWRAILSHTDNYGNNCASTERLSSNTAWMLEVRHHAARAWGLDFGMAIAGDGGKQWGNTAGILLTISKKGFITSW